MRKLLLGIFENRDDVEQAIDTLESNDFNVKDISIAMKDDREAKDIEDSTGANVAGSAASGATTGAVVGGIAGLLAGTVMPALGGFLIGGPIGAALGLTGAAATTVSGAATGAAAGGLLGALMGFGLPKEDAQQYETRVKEGAILLAVPVTDDQASTARDIFEEFDATDIRSVEQPTSKKASSREKPERHEEESTTSTHKYQFVSGAKGGSTKGKR